MAKSQEIIAEFIGERNVFQNTDGSRVIIATVQDANGADITIKGEAMEGLFSRGLTYRLFGQWREHNRYGRQFWFSSVVQQEPVSEEGTIAYICKFQGIGRATASKIWAAFGERTIDTLQDSPELVCETVPRLKLEDMQEAAKYIKLNRGRARATIELLGLMDGRGFPKKTIDRAINEWGVKAPEIIRQNPFALMIFSGCGFLKCDKFYLDLGLDPAWIGRQSQCAWHATVKAADGSTWLPEAQIRGAIRAALAGVKADPDAALKHAIEVDKSLILAEHGGQRWVAERDKALAEQAIADHIAAALGETETQWPAVTGDEISEHQREALAIATQSMVGCLTGSPGVGKTYTAAQLINAIINEHGHNAVRVAAPTGKAAVRLTEALESSGVQNVAVSTIHRMLGVQSTGGDGFKFNHDEDLPLPVKFLIVDESSMIDTNLMHNLLCARGAGTHVLFIGDPGQLAPVGHGKPFLDLMSRVPTGHLTEIRRNSGDIVATCATIRKGAFSLPIGASYKGFWLEEGHNLAHKPNTTADGIIRDMEVWYTTQFLGPVTGWREPLGDIDPIWDIQVLVPVNTKSNLSRCKLNLRLQEKLNPNGAKFKDHPFRIGDKVVCLKNQMLDDISGEEVGTAYVANGELGEVVSIEPACTVIRLSLPDRLVKVPRAATKAAGPGMENNRARSGSGKEIQLDERDASEDEDKQSGSYGDWDLGYALSVHKAQGSDWPIVILPIDDSPAASRVMSRNWVYTAISRAKSACYLIGDTRHIDKAVRKDGIAGRKTILADRLAGDEIEYPVIKLPEPIVLDDGDLAGIFNLAEV